MQFAEILNLIMCFVSFQTIFVMMIADAITYARQHSLRLQRLAFESGSKFGRFDLVREFDVIGWSGVSSRISECEAVRDPRRTRMKVMVYNLNTLQQGLIAWSYSN